MHPSSFDNMAAVLDRLHTRLFSAPGTRVLEIGSMDVNGGYRPLLGERDATYTGVDIEAGPGVDLVLEDPSVLPFGDGTFDLVLSGQMLEHSPFFWRTFAEMARVLDKRGVIVLIAPSSGPIHRYPVDCYRFYPDAFASLAELVGLQLLDVRLDERGPWRDLVGVFSRSGEPVPNSSTRPLKPLSLWPRHPDESLERRVGSDPYLDVLARLHQKIAPAHYLEIGVRHGASLSLARRLATGVDPQPEVANLPAQHRIVPLSSDDFFASAGAKDVIPPPSLVFIDGLHTFEQTLRDFMHVERIADPEGAVVIDDVLPNHPIQASRVRQSAVWTGDVWKITEILREHRPDLRLELVDADPCGLLIISNLDPTNRVLWETYNPVVRRWMEVTEPPSSVLDRTGALTADCISALGPAPPQGPSFELSIVVVAYNMPRELPRTLRSLSTLMQLDIEVDQYEVIVVDNGSTVAVDRAACLQLPMNLRFHDLDGPTVSPVPAVNWGLRMARGRLVGVMIDGARMASPRLLANALAAHRSDSTAVVASHAFHLGRDTQMNSVRDGYNEDVEDHLLGSIPWEQDGYALFDVGVFAGSSQEGWFASPAESNAVFATAELWHRIGGFDEAFTSPGGGLANHDALNRACTASGSLTLLLGEATFHQFHGGVATNSLHPSTALFVEEYERIRGQPFQRDHPTPSLYGKVGRHHRTSLQESILALGAREAGELGP